jgi:hypothetical protein
MAHQAALCVLLAWLCAALAKPYGGSECQGVIDFTIAVSAVPGLLVVISGGRAEDLVNERRGEGAWGMKMCVAERARALPRDCLSICALRGEIGLRRHCFGAGKEMLEYSRVEGKKTTYLLEI